MDFFNKIGKTISNGVSGTASKTKELTEVQKLNSTINQQKNEIESKYAEMGKLYFEKFGENGQIGELNALSAEIRKILEEIEANKDKINEIKGLKKCESCGEPIDNGSVFCPICGAKQSVVVPRCVKCGSVLEEGAKFCAKCGTRQPDIESPVPAQPVAVPASAEPVPQPEPVVPEEVIIKPEPVIEPEPLIESEPVVEPESEIVPEFDKSEEDVVPDFVPAQEFDADDIAPVEKINEPQATAEVSGKACPNCGSFVPEDSAFCTECGTSLKEEPKSGGFVFCTNCGNKEEAGTKFCSQCGTKLD